MNVSSTRSTAAPFAVLVLVLASVCDARNMKNGRCDEVYVVEEGETLQTISVKCNSICILDDNPQIRDTDDVGPGTVLLVRSNCRGLKY